MRAPLAAFRPASFDSVWRETRLALRALRRSPGFTTTVIVTLALGIGANVAMFGIVDRLLYRPLAYLRDPSSVHRLYWQWEDRTTSRTTRSTAYRRYLDLQEGTSSFEQFAAVSERDVAVGEGSEAVERRIGAVSASYFDFFDARPALGRFFTRAEDQVPRGEAVAVLSWALWQGAYGGRDVRGERVQVGDVRAEIIGVAPRGFAGVNDASPPALWIPITTYAGSTGTNDARTYFQRYSWGWLNVLVRRKAGVAVDEATADATRALRESWRNEATFDPTLRPVDAARPRVVVGPVRPGAGPNPALEERTAVWVEGVAVLVLLIACANVGNLLLARALRRRRETAVRLAIGASRQRLLLQSVIESSALALVAGVAATVVAQWGGGIVRRLLLPSAVGLTIYTDWRSLAVTLALTLAVGLTLGVVPALVASRFTDLAASLRGGVRAGHRDGGRLRATFLVVQVSLTVTLLVGAGLFVRSLRSVMALPMGYDAERVLLVNRVIRGLPMTDSAQLPLRRALLEAAQSLPDVEAAAWVSSAPFVSTSSTALFVPGIDSVGRLGVFTYQATSPDYFRVMGTRVVRGRAFTAGDRLGGENVMVISQSMARVLWGAGDPIGKCITVWREDQPCRTVVGVAEDMVQTDIATGTRFHFYLPIDQFTRTWGNGMLLKLRGDPAVLQESVRAALQRSMPGASYVTTVPLQEIVDGARTGWRMAATMFAGCGLLALLVAAVGLHGVIAYNAAQRASELGVRAALGAKGRDIAQLVMGEGVRFTLVGAALGIGAATLAGTWVQPLLFRQSAHDPAVLGGVGAVMLLVALGASLAPALRAARTDPARVLRDE